MPIHDWTRVDAGIFHHFHGRWIGEISDALNAGLLPPGYYALGEQVTGDIGPDVLALEFGPNDSANGTTGFGPSGGTIAVATAPPRVQFTAQCEMLQYVQKQNHLVIRHASGDRVVALVEIVSAGNKASQVSLRAFVEKVAEALFQGYHLLILDLQPPTSRDPNGIHGAIWSEVADDLFRAPVDKPLTLAAYSAGFVKKAYVQPVAVGEVLPDMPLFLEPNAYINVPLEKTYAAAFQSVPERWRRVIEGRA